MRHQRKQSTLKEAMEEDEPQLSQSATQFLGNRLKTAASSSAASRTYILIDSTFLKVRLRMLQLITDPVTSAPSKNRQCITIHIDENILSVKIFSKLQDFQLTFPVGFYILLRSQ